MKPELNSTGETYKTLLSFPQFCPKYNIDIKLILFMVQPRVCLGKLHKHFCLLPSSKYSRSFCWAYM